MCIGGCQSEKSPFSARYEDGKLYYEGEWYVVLWLTYICEFVTAVHKWHWLLRLNYTPRVMFVDSYAKALIIIISSSHSFLRFHKGDHVLIESRNDTHSRYVYSSYSWCYMLSWIYFQICSFRKDFSITILSHTLQFHLFTNL